MGPTEAAFGVINFLKDVKTVIPMHYGLLPIMTGTVEQF